MIRECRDKQTSDFLAGKRVKQFQACAKSAGKALTKLQAAVVLYDLRRPPSNHFEALGNGRYSIRINRQWRVCFRWQLLAGGDIGTTPGEAYDVEINKHYE
jgi:proteic killer suppression protein